MERCLCALALGVCLSTGAAADVTIHYGASSDDPTTPELEVFPGVNPLTIGLSSTVDGFETGAIAFSFEDAAIPELTLSNFEWDDVFGDINMWFANPTLPEPAVVAFFGGLPVPPAPDQVQVATMDADIESVPIGTLLTLPTGAQVIDSVIFEPVPLTPGSESVTFRVVPEPSAHALLAAGLVCVRRQRRRG